jgi:putative transposase
MVFFRHGNRQVSKGDLVVPQLKGKHNFLKSVFSSPLKNVALRMARAIAAHRKSRNGTRPGPAAGWITYKAWAREWMSLEYDEPNKGWSVAEFGWLTLSFGTNGQGKRMSVRMKMIDPPKGIARARTCRIVREGKDRYFAVFTFCRKKKDQKRQANAVYIDPNHKNFGYALDTHGHATEIDNLELKQSERMLDKLASLRDRCTKKSLGVDTVRADGTVSTRWRPSRRWHRFNAALVRLQAKVRDQKKHFMYSLANRLCRQYDIIGIGNYVPANADHGKGTAYNRAVRNRTLHGSFKDIVSWVATRSGRKAAVLDEAGTTRTCHVCDHVVAGGIHPRIRQWECPSCGTHHLRDENACQNGLRRMLAPAGGVAGNLQLPCSGPVPVLGRCDRRFHPQGWQEIPQGSANANSMHPSEHRRRTQRAQVRRVRGDDHASKPKQPGAPSATLRFA